MGSSFDDRVESLLRKKIGDFHRSQFGLSEERDGFVDRVIDQLFDLYAEQLSNALYTDFLNLNSDDENHEDYNNN